MEVLYILLLKNKLRIHPYVVHFKLHILIHNLNLIIKIGFIMSLLTSKGESKYPSYIVSGKAEIGTDIDHKYLTKCGIPQNKERKNKDIVDCNQTIYI